MFATQLFSFKILSVLKLTWNKHYKYAFPRAFHALSFRVKGNAEFIHESKKFIANENSLLFMPKDYDYIIDAKQNEEVIVIHFDSVASFDSPEIFNPENHDEFLLLFNEILSVWNTRPVGYKFRLNALFNSILEAIEIHTQKQNITRSANEQFEYSVSFLRSNLSNHDITIEKLATLAHVSPTYYRKLFNKIYGTSPLKYLNELRLKRAKALLQTGYYSVESVSTQCGFIDPKYFSTCYKKYFGNSPDKDRLHLYKNI